MRDKIKEWNNMVVTGLVNGLTKTIHDGRTDDIIWVARRLQLFESFARCVMDLETGQDYQYAEKDLKDISELGYHEKDNDPIVIKKRIHPVSRTSPPQPTQEKL